MKYTYSLSPSILADFNRYHWFRFFLRKRYVFSVALIILFIGTNIALSPYKTTLLFYALIFISLFAFTYWLVYFITLRNSFKEDPLLSGERDLEISREQIRVITSSVNTTFKWSRITRFAETGLSYLLYSGRNQVVIVPKYIFKTPDERTTFVDFVCDRTKFKKFRS